jgi:branched-chain amino acid transport system substrate-binding protein
MREMRLGLPALLGAVLAASLVGGAAMAQTNIKVGVLNTYSGPNSQVGDEMEKGLELYYNTHKKDLPPGVTIELVKRDDTGANPEVAKRLVQEMVTRDHVQLLLGVVWSPNAAAITPVLTEAKLPFIDTNAAGVSIVRMTPYMIRTSFTLWQQAYPLGKWAAGHGYKRAYSAVSDFIPGHEGEEAFTKGFTDGGGKMVDTVRFPLASPDFVPYMQKVKDAKPDVLYIFVPAGTQATAIMKAAADVDLKSAGIAIVSTQDLVPDEEIPNMGDQAVGLVTSGVYSADATRPANKAFLADWKTAYGTKFIPDFLSADAYDGMTAVFDLVKQTKGKFTGDEAMAILKNWKDPDSPKGPVMIDPATRDIIQNVYMRRVEKQGSRYVDVEFETIPNVKDPWKEMNPPK